MKLAGFCVAKTAAAYAILIYCPEQSIPGCAAVESESEGDAGLELKFVAGEQTLGITLRIQKAT